MTYLISFAVIIIIVMIILVVGGLINDKIRNQADTLLTTAYITNNYTTGPIKVISPDYINITNGSNAFDIILNNTGAFTNNQKI